MGERDELLERLLASFKVEAEERLQGISSGLVKLENEDSPEAKAAIVETIYREAHSLKGAARAVSKGSVETLCQSIESIFSELKKDAGRATGELLDTLHRAVDVIGELVVVQDAGDAVRTKGILKELKALEKSTQDDAALVPGSPDEGSVPEPQKTRAEVGKTAPPASPPAPSDPSPHEAEATDGPAPVQAVDEAFRDPAAAAAKRVASGTVRVPAERLDSLFRQAEEMLTAKLAAERRASVLLNMSASLGGWTTEYAKVLPEIVSSGPSFAAGGDGETPTERGPKSRELLTFLDTVHSRIGSLRAELAALARSSEADAQSFGRMLDGLLESMKQVLMLPFSSLFDVFPRMIRDLSRDAGKEIELVLEGGDVEVDKRVLEEIRNPLIHLLRNCVDHGVEAPEQREALGKPRRGRISVTAVPMGSGEVAVLVADDGSGVDLGSVRAAAMKAGIVSGEEAEGLDEDRILSLVYESGVSSSPIVTDMSGRGLGLAIVREKIEELGGSLSIKSTPNCGTSFRLLLPLTLSAVRGILVQAAGQVFIVPTANVNRALRLNQDDVATVENRETIRLNRDVISLVRLDDVLDLPRAQLAEETSASVAAVVLSAGGRRIAFAVDAVLGEQEVLIKKLGRQLVRVPNIAGAMVQSSGEVVLVLNVADLIKSAVGHSVLAGEAAGVSSVEQTAPKSILVVEDSITSRMLLKNILESAGYRVDTAVDGIDALTKLKMDAFDLVVSDVDMPRMNGFELTAMMRSEERISELPLVLVTSLESREHRERGVEVGANAYIAKSSFEQSNLVETIERLI